MNGKAKGSYAGERSAASIKDWALGLLPNHVATVNKQARVHIPYHDSGLAATLTVQNLLNLLSLRLEPSLLHLSLHLCGLSKWYCTVHGM